MAGEPFLRPLGDSRFAPNPVARGPWSATSLHARVLAGLFAHEIESRWLQPGFRCARLTVDLYRLPSLAPGEVSSRVVRDGNRICVVETEYTSEGKSFARASGVLLRESENPPGKAWSRAVWEVPPPDAVAAREEWAGNDPIFEVRRISAGNDPTSQQRSWTRDTRTLIEGVPLTPFVRAALAADFTNPFANWSTEGLQFINADITLYLHRYPEGEWIGFEVADHQADGGISFADCALYDEAGPVGHSAVCGVANGPPRK